MKISTPSVWLVVPFNARKLESVDCNILCIKLVNLLVKIVSKTYHMMLYIHIIQDMLLLYLGFAKPLLGSDKS